MPRHRDASTGFGRVMDFARFDACSQMWHFRCRSVRVQLPLSSHMCARSATDASPAHAGRHLPRNVCESSLRTSKEAHETSQNHARAGRLTTRSVFSSTTKITITKMTKICGLFVNITKTEITTGDGNEIKTIL